MSFRAKVEARETADIDLVGDDDWPKLLDCLKCLADHLDKLSRKHNIDRDRISHLASQSLRQRDIHDI